MEQGGLARAVASDKPDAFASLEMVGQPFDEQAVAVGSFDFVQLDNLAAKSFWDDGEVEWVLLDAFGGFRFQVLETVESALAFGGARRGARPIRVPASCGVAPALHSLGVGTALATLFEKVTEVAVVAVQGLVFQFKDAVTHVFQEVAVVGHHEQGGAHGGQTLLQPRDHVQVEVVGRFVQHQKFRRFQQHLSQRHPPFFTSTQARNLPLQIMQFSFPISRARASKFHPSWASMAS